MVREVKHGSAALVALALLVPHAVANAGGERPRQLDVALIWTTHEHVYLVPAATERISIGDDLEFEYRKKPIATARVTSRTEAVCVATVTSGSFERAKKKLSKVRVFAIPAPPLEPVPLLRVGIPSPQRTNPIFACAPSPVPIERPPSTFRVEAANVEGYLRIRVGEPHLVPWPDTLAVRWFDEVTDQEIALERGELDVAVFWPGEPTGRLRDGERWGFALGTRARGVVAAMWPAGGAGWVEDTTDKRGPGVDDSPSGAGPGERLRFAGSARFRELNEQMFRGDLAPWPALRVEQPFALSARHIESDEPSGPARFTVDLSIPGWRAIERFLNHGVPDDAPVVRIVYLDESVGDAAVRSTETMRIEPLFAVRCPVVYPSQPAKGIDAIGADAWAELLRCGPSSHGP